MPSADCELIDLEDLIGQKGFQWLLGRVRSQWGADAFADRITKISKDASMSPDQRQTHIGNVIVAREAVFVAFGEVDREISKRRAAVRENKTDDMVAQRHRGDTL